MSSLSLSPRSFLFSSPSFSHSFDISHSLYAFIHQSIITHRPVPMKPPIPPLPPPATQAFPQFYIIRPNLQVVPLIALDELPFWMQVGNWNWMDLSLYKNMFPASLSPVPRLGEYDVICHNCSANIDVLHRSISQRNEPEIPQDLGNKTPSSPEEAGPGHGRCSLDANSDWTIIHDPRQQQSISMTAGNFLPLLPLKQPPFQACLQTPLVGMCLVDIPQSIWADPFVTASVLSDGMKSPTSSNYSNTSKGSGSSLNPEAPTFSPVDGSPSQSRCSSSACSRLSSDCAMSMSPVTTCACSRCGSRDGANKENVDPNKPSTPRSSCSSQGRDDDILVEELKRALGIKPPRKQTTQACRRNPPMANSPKDKQKKPFQSEPKEKRCTRRRAQKEVYAKRPGRRNISFKELKVTVKRQTNSAMKRQERREKLAKRHNQVAAGQYWHMMMVPGWDPRVPRR